MNKEKKNKGKRILYHFTHICNIECLTFKILCVLYWSINLQKQRGKPLTILTYRKNTREKWQIKRFYGGKHFCRCTRIILNVTNGMYHMWPGIVRVFLMSPFLCRYLFTTPSLSLAPWGCAKSIKTIYNHIKANNIQFT